MEEIGSRSRNRNCYNHYASSSSQILMPPRPSSLVNPNLNEMSMKTKVMAHPLFPRLMFSYVNCQKVGAPGEVVERLEHVALTVAATSSVGSRKSEAEVEPELDRFMEAYCEMLTKYHQELTKPFQEAMLGLSKINSQLNALTSFDYPSVVATL